MAPVNGTSLYSQISRLARGALEIIKVAFGRFTCSIAEGCKRLKAACHQQPKASVPLQEKKTVVVPPAETSATTRFCKKAGSMLFNAAGTLFYKTADATEYVGKNLAYAGGYTVGGATGVMGSLVLAAPAWMVDRCLNTQLATAVICKGASVGSSGGGKVAYSLADGTCSLLRAGFRGGAAIAKGVYRFATDTPGYSAADLDKQS